MIYFTQRWETKKGAASQRMRKSHGTVFQHAFTCGYHLATKPRASPIGSSFFSDNSQQQKTLPYLYVYIDTYTQLPGNDMMETHYRHSSPFASSKDIGKWGCRRDAGKQCHKTHEKKKTKKKKRGELSTKTKRKSQERDEALVTWPLFSMAGPKNA